MDNKNVVIECILWFKIFWLDAKFALETITVKTLFICIFFNLLLRYIMLLTVFFLTSTFLFFFWILSKYINIFIIFWFNLTNNSRYSKLNMIITFSKYLQCVLKIMFEAHFFKLSSKLIKVLFPSFFWFFLITYQVFY